MSKIKILSSALAELATVEDVIASSRTESINELNTLTFSFYLTEDNYSWINETNVIGLDDDYFDIATYKNAQASDGILTCAVNCEHISYRLNDTEYNLDTFAQTGTPTEVLTAILSGTGFTVGTVEFTDAVTYSTQEAMSRRAILVQYAEYLEGELLYDGFTISILAQRGSATAKDLTAGRNIDVISKNVDKTTLDDDGNYTIAYECTLVYPNETLSLGDVVTMAYARLGIDVTLRIASITTNPYNKYEVSFSVSNTVGTIEAAAYKIATSTVTKDKIYNGCRIGPTYGFEAIRSDDMARAYFASDTMAMQSGDGTGSNWKNRLYYNYDSDKEEATFVFDGTLTADCIKSSGVTISAILQAINGSVTYLTVAALTTDTKIQKYLASSTADINYIKIYEQYHLTVTASTDGSATEHVEDADGNPLYWMEEPTTANYRTLGVTTDTTDWPVTIYVYDELVKKQTYFYYDSPSGEYIAMDVWGVGTTGNADYDKLSIFKPSDAAYIRYVTDVGKTTRLKFTKDINAGGSTICFDEYDNGESGSDLITIDWTKGNYQVLTLTGGCAIQFVSPSGSCSVSLRLVQDSTGGRDMPYFYPSGSYSVKWAGKTVPSLTSDAGAEDILCLQYRDGVYYCSLVADFGTAS